MSSLFLAKLIITFRIKMASRWLLALVGYALIQGIIANSPEPVPEDEMEEFFRMLRSPDYRLPTTTSPRHYEVNLTPYLDVAPPGSQPFTFDGTVKIFANVTAPTDRQIVLHCNDLTIITLTVTRPDSSLNIAAPEQTFVCEMPYSFLKIDVTEDLSVGDEFIIESSFRGILQSNMRGFYRSWYSEGNERRWIATTQFQPGHARQAFPCYDEPSFKATFEITINRLLEYSPTISNMPIRINDTLPNGRISETFYTTPLTSTYLLAFIVSRYQNIAANNDDIRPFDIYARGTANGTGDWALEVGEKLLARMEEYTQFPYYTMALYDGLPSMNMKQAAIPDFSAGAMENWGLLTYREANVLYDPLNSNHFYKQRVANIVAHEIAHMWFGNLVTCDWWSELWLNEGFARFYQYYLTAMVEPDLGMDTRFVIEQLQTSMFSDSLDSAHALSNPEVYDPTSVSNHFSTITYAKGASVIRMTQYLLGNETFLSGLRRYLVDRQFSTAEPHHLFEALDSAAAENNALRGYGINIAEYFKTWSEKSGHPLLTVNVNQRTGHMTVTQSRWERNSGESNSPSLWYVPVTWTRGGAPDFEDCKPSQVLTGQASFIDRGSTGLEWVIFNKQQTGFYRVNYDPTNWALLTQAMRNVTTQKEIHGHNRAQIVDDVLTFARAGLMPYNTAFNIISFLEFDEDYAPWLAAINDFEFIIRRLAHDEVNFQRFKNEIIRMSSTLTNYLGYDEKPEDSYMDGLQRMYVMQFLCDIGHSECVTAARDHFQRWRNGEHVAPNLRPWAYCVGLREGTPDDFTFFWNKYLEESLANEVVVMLQAAGCTSNQISLNTFLDAIINPSEIVRPQDVATAFNSAIGGNEENAMRVFEWLKSNVDNVIDALSTAATPISGIAGRLKNEDQITEFQNWLDENQVLLGAAYTTGINGIQTTRNNLQWSSVRIPELVQYLDVGYVEEVIDDVDVEEGGNGGGDGDGSGDNGGDGSAGTDSGEDITEGETDSANVALLGVMTLLTSVCVNVIAG